MVAKTEALIAPGQDSDSLHQSLFRPVWQPTPSGWWLLFVPSLGAVGIFLVCVYLTVTRGIGEWGNQIPVAWGFGITDFVWWIGIGHAGTLISAILLLFIQKWRTSINRIAEAMTLFAVMCAGMFPVLHLGRPWYLYWLFPYPSTMRVWPQFRSPLTWDVVAVSTYFLVSLIFWFMGLVPDFAALRDSSPTRMKRIVYGICSLGWRGTSNQWRQYQMTYLLLGGLATPLVISVHSIVSFDFAVSLVPGWHETIFPPYFVAGAIFSGMAMVILLLVPIRWALKLEHVITQRHLDAANKVTLAMSWIVAYGYATEHFINRYTGNPYDVHQYATRVVGHYNVFWALMVGFNALVPQLFWSKRVRTTPWLMWPMALLINVGMYLERFIIVVNSLYRDYLPSRWRDFSPSLVDIGLLSGSVGVFLTGYLLFLRFIPPVPVSELKELEHELREEAA
jgi:molybdopterin-containing oxidoreductase family membrane subunit